MPTPARRLRFLIVHPPSPLVPLLKERLERAGYETQLLTSFEDAFELFVANPRAFDAVVIDRGEKKEGLKFLKELGYLGRQPLLSLLLTDREDLRRDFGELGDLDAIFTKPLRLDRLMEHVRLLIQRKRLPLLRRFERTPLRMRIRVKTLRLRRFRRFETTDLSEGGMFIKCSERVLGSGESVLFTIHPGSRNHPPLKGLGRVRWYRALKQKGHDIRHGYGIEFTTLFYNVSSRDVRRFINAQPGTRPKYRVRELRF